MEVRPFGPSRIPLPVVGQGTWKMEQDPESSVRALQAGLDRGMTHIDTAEMYGDGAVEGIVARAIAGRRDGVYLVSKVLPSHASYEGTLRACEQSLRRLATDRLDLYLLHWRGETPLEETFRAFDELRRGGKVLQVGVSNFDVQDLQEAVACEPRIACNQVLYHLGQRSIEHDVIPWCREKKIAVVAYSPFGQGQFPEPATAGGRVLKEIAMAHRATVRQVALRFLLRYDNVFVIPKSSRLEHVAENAGAGTLQLSESEISRLEKAFPSRPSPSLPTL